MPPPPPCLYLCTHYCDTIGHRRSWEGGSDRCMAYDENNENLYRGVAYVSHMFFGYHRSPATWRRGPHVRWAVSLGASLICTNIRTEGFYVKTTMIHHLKRLSVPHCTCREIIMFMNFIHITLNDVCLMQNILYETKRDMAVSKRLGCPQRKQRTWLQIVSTPYTGLP